MGNKHLKSLNTPPTWNVDVKKEVYVTRPNPGAHRFSEGMSAIAFLRDIIGVAQTRKEINYILTQGVMLVDGVQRKDRKFIIGLMDTVAFPSTKSHHRIILNAHGKLNVIPISEAESKLKVCKITGKNMHHGKVQLTLFDGRTIVGDAQGARVGDSLLIEVPGSKVKELLRLEKGSLVLINGGKHAGAIVRVDALDQDTITCSSKEKSFNTAKRYAFVVGKEKPSITLSP